MTAEVRNILIGLAVACLFLGWLARDAWAQSYAQPSPNAQSNDGNAQHHHPLHSDAYHDWKTRHGMSCCNDKDCAPTTAWQDMDGNWLVRSGGETYPVDPLAILPIPSPDGRSHACILGGRVICFVPGEVRG